MPVSDRAQEHLFNEIISYYESTIQSLFKEQSPGKIRTTKAKMVEEIAKKLVLCACKDANLDNDKIYFKQTTYVIPLHDSYLKGLADSYLKKYISKHKEKFFYRLGCDVQCYYGNRFLLAIECKSYTENAMLKRVLVDFSLLKNIFPDTQLVLLQLESMLGGDYSSLKSNIKGSKATHTIMSYFFRCKLTDYHLAQR
ncbi:MAG: restriction endonuclease [Pseudomonadota bacterium]|nr:restriction endonuclease [Pseudomonadota bacterium]